MIDVTVILGVTFVALDKKSEFPCCFIEASSKLGKNEIFASQAKNVSERARITSLAGK